MEEGWLLQDPKPWDHGKAVDQEVIFKRPCLAKGLQAWGPSLKPFSNYLQAPGFSGITILVLLPGIPWKAGN